MSDTFSNSIRIMDCLPIKIITRAVIYIIFVIFHAQKFITIITPIIFKLIECLKENYIIVLMYILQFNFCTAFRSVNYTNNFTNVMHIMFKNKQCDCKNTLIKEHTKQALKPLKSLGTVSKDMVYFYIIISSTTKSCVVFIKQMYHTTILIVLS